MNGVVNGGWDYVIAAYIFTFGALALYLVSVVVRLRQEKRAELVADEAARLESEEFQQGSGTEALS